MVKWQFVCVPWVMVDQHFTSSCLFVFAHVLSCSCEYFQHSITWSKNQSFFSIFCAIFRNMSYFWHMSGVHNNFKTVLILSKNISKMKQNKTDGFFNILIVFFVLEARGSRRCAPSATRSATAKVV